MLVIEDLDEASVERAGLAIMNYLRSLSALSARRGLHVLRRRVRRKT